MILYKYRGLIMNFRTCLRGSLNLRGLRVYYETTKGFFKKVVRPEGYRPIRAVGSKSNVPD
jgi:hypothetical protein